MGPLPQLHTYIVAAVVVALCLATGVWLAGHFALPLGGVGLGLASGLLIAYVVTRGPRRHHRTR